MLSPEIQAYACRSVLCWLATVDEAGQPNVSQKEIYAVFDADHLVIANIASPASVRNVRSNPKVCVSFLDILVQKGFKVFGTARNIEKNDPEYEVWAAPLLARTGSRFPIHSVLAIRSQSVDPILAPSYLLYPDETTEQSQFEAALRAYGVRRAQGDA